MAETTLRAYLSEIEDLIDHSQLDEAVAHSRHILSIFPKHVDTYRLLGKALLEQNRHSDAADIFQRVISVAPDDFVSHVGMAIIREDESNVDGAIWHMERAFENQPANAAIQEELRRLYGRRDGIEPQKIRLTRGALARTYARGGLYPQAISEIQSNLAEQPERYDLRVLYAEVLWRNNQKAEAAETCAGIIEKLPFCLEANRILADIWLASGRPDEASIYRTRLEALDPYEAFADRSANGSGAAAAPAQSVRLPKLDWSPAAEAKGAGAAPEWMSALGLSFEQPATAASVPDWLAASAQPATGPAPADTADLPDWLREMGAVSLTTPPTPAGDDWLTGISAPSTADSGAGLPDWMATPPAPQPAPGAPETPDWLTGVSPISPEGKVATPGPAMPAISSDLPMPDWLKAEESGAYATPSTKESPDWLSGVTPATAPAAEAAAPSMETSAVPDWIAAETGAAPQASSSGELPGWLSASAPTTQPSAEPAVPDWLSASETPPPAETTPAAPIPDWLAAQGWGPATGAADERGTSMTPEPESQDSLPEWLRPPSEAGSPAADIPDSLRSTGEPAEPPEWLRAPSAEAVAPAEPVAESDMPAWLRALAPAAPAEPASGVPLVLPAFLEEQPPTTSDSVARFLKGKETESPEWLRPPAEQPPAAPPSAKKTPALTAPLTPLDTAPLHSGEMPEWLREVLAEETAPAAAPSDSDWLAQLRASEGKTGQELMSGPVSAESPFRGEPESFAPPPPSPTADKISLAGSDEPEVWVSPDQEPAAPALPVRPALSAKPREPESPRAPLPPVGPIQWAEEKTKPTKAGAAQPSATPAAPPLDREDEALAWLEALAAKHGAKEEEMVTRPEARSEEMPAWLRESATKETTAPAPPTRPGKQSPEWLRAAEEPSAPPTMTQAPIPTPTAATPALSLESEDEALAWLEGLAAKHGAKEEEMITRPEARSDEMPAWLRESPTEEPAALAPAPAEPEAQPAEFIPDWLLAAQPPAPPTAMTEAPAPATTPLESEDEALAWLEGLAAKHGAKEEEMVTRPEARTEEMPAWLREAAVAQPTAETPAALLAGPAEELPEWLREAATAGIPSALTPAVIETPSPATTPHEAEDAGLAWLEALAAKHGAKEEELITRPETRTEEMPAWLREPAVEEPQPEPPAAPPAKPAEELPEWLREAEVPASVVWSDQEGPLPDWLTISQESAAALAAGTSVAPAPAAPREPVEAPPPIERVPPKPTEPPPTFVAPQTPPAEPRGWPAGVWPPAEVAAPAAELVTRPPLEPVAAPPAEPVEILAERPAAEEPPEVRPVEAKAVERPHPKAKARRSARKGALPADPPEVRLTSARMKLREGNAQEALELYDGLIKSNELVDTIIADLEAAVEKEGDGHGLLRALGDAYMRDNRLQKALEVYQQALAQL